MGDEGWVGCERRGKKVMGKGNGISESKANGQQLGD